MLTDGQITEAYFTLLWRILLAKRKKKSSETRRGKLLVNHVPPSRPGGGRQNGYACIQDDSNPSGL